MTNEQKNTHLQIAFKKAATLENGTMIRITGEPESYWVMKDTDGTVYIGYPAAEAWAYKNHFYKTRSVVTQYGYWQQLVQVKFKTV